ncbi:MAG: type II toxin-antitoxin system VapC family toxin [Terracidiphilus sp.]|jgi:predicted nucleic acid-binding protein
MAFVLDASVTLSWAFPDEDNPVAIRAGQLLESSAESALVPSLWWYEVRNILIVSERRRRTTPLRTASFLKEIADLSIVIDFSQDESIVLELARQTHLTVYDAAYLALAMRERIPLATLDKNLREAALATGVELLA